MRFRDLLGAACGVERRHQRRYELPTGVVLKVVAGNRSVTSRIEDISLGGACVRLSAPLRGDPNIELTHPKIGRIRGARIWARGNRIGYRFEKSSSSLDLFVHCMKLMVPAPRHF